MKESSSFDYYESPIATTFYNKNGESCDEGQECAKSVNVNGVEHYYIWFVNAIPYESHNISQKLNRTSPYSKLKKVREEQFKHYVKYLKTRNRQFFNLSCKVL